MSNAVSPLSGLQCVVCGMKRAKPTEQLVLQLGGLVISINKIGPNSLPDVVVCDNASSESLQTVLQMWLDVPVVTKEWVDNCSKASARLPFESFQLPVLNQCIISFTNIAKARRTAFQSAVERAGGLIAPDMSRTSTHLAVGDPSKPSNKLSAAQNWGITKVNVKWLEDCLEQGRILPTCMYRISSSQHSRHKSASASGRQLSSSTDVQQAKATSTGTGTHGAQGTYSGQPSRSSPSHAAPDANLASDAMSNKPSRLHSTHSSQLAKVSNIPNASDLERHRDNPRSLQPNLMRHGDDHRSLAVAPRTPPPAARAHTPLQGVQPEQHSIPAQPLTQTQAGKLEHMDMYFVGLSPQQHLDCAHIVSRFKGSRSLKLRAFTTHVVVGDDIYDSDRTEIAAHTAARPGICSVVSAQWLTACLADGGCVPTSDYLIDTSDWLPSEDVCADQARQQSQGRVFEGYHFCLDALKSISEKKQAKEYIRTLGGQELVAGSMKLVTDWSRAYAVCPPSLPQEAHRLAKQQSKTFPQIAEKNYCNLFWLRVCMSHQQLVPHTSQLFDPIRHAVPFSDFSNVVVVISGYGDGARQGICHCINVMGGQCLEVVTKQQWPSVTHLIIDGPVGAKFRVAQNRGIPCVSTSWLMACTGEGRLVHPEKYRVLPPEGMKASTQTQTLPDRMESTQALPQNGAASFVGIKRPVQRPRMPRTILRQAVQSSHSQQMMCAPSVRSMSGMASASGVEGANATLPGHTGSQSAHLGFGSNSILQQLSQDLGSLQTGANVAGPCDFRDLSTSVRTTPSQGRSRPANPDQSALHQAQNAIKLPHPTPPHTTHHSHMLDRFAEAHGVEPSSILGTSNKRVAHDPASTDTSAASKRARTTTSDGRDPVLAGMASARQTALSILADALAPCLRGDGATVQNGTQTCSQSLLIDPAINLSSGPHKPTIQSARSRRQARLHAQETMVDDAPKDTWELTRDGDMHSTQVAFSQQVDFGNVQHGTS